MKSMLAAAALALALAAPGGPLLAQNPGRPPAGQPPQAGAGEIRGTVVDAESGNPVPSASVGVWSRADSVLVAGAIARPDGTFRVQGLRPGRYWLRVTMLGYGSRNTGELTVAEGAARADAGRITLARSAVALEGLDVTAERAVVAIAPDRNSYRSRDVAPAASTASEVLEAVPSVQVDSEGRVSFRGNENVVVQINGRPSPIRGAQLAGYLKQLPANTIERVEVVPNPSARHDPEGMAGIINIVLKQNVDLGTSGGLTVGASSEDRYWASGNLGYQRGAATWLATYGYNSDRRDVRGVNDRTRLGAERAPLSFTEQDIAGRSGNDGHNLTASLDYRLTSRDVLSASLQANSRGATDGSLSAYSELDASRTLLETYERVRDSEADNRMLDGALAFKRTLEPQKHEISAEVRYNGTDDRDRTDLWRQPAGGAGTGRDDAELDELEARTHQLTAQFDYTRPLAEQTKLETGYKGNVRWLDRDYTVWTDALGSGTFSRSDLSNALELDERVNAVYGVVSHGAGPFELQAGLRAEYASRDFSLGDSGERFPHSYTSLFPSGLVSYKIGEKTQVKLSYSRRIRRPGTQELNPFPVFFDLQNVFLGNPELDPEYTDAIELGYQYSARAGSLQVSPFYRRTSDVIRFIINTADSVAGREVTSISFENLDHGTSWGADVNGSLRLGQRFNGFGGFNVFKMVTEGGGGEQSLSSNAVTWTARVNGTYNLTPRTSFQAMYFYRAPMNIERGRFSSSSFANLSVRHMLRGEKASVTLRVSDPFDSNRFRVEAGDDNIVQLTERSFNNRALHLTFQYNFGQAPRVRQRPQEQPQQGGSPFGG
jgi:outer membrane receptor protein involved in Fe transport